MSTASIFKDSIPNLHAPSPPMLRLEVPLEVVFTHRPPAQATPLVLRRDVIPPGVVLVFCPEVPIPASPRGGGGVGIAAHRALEVLGVRSGSFATGHLHLAVEGGLTGMPHSGLLLALLLAMRK